MMKRWLFSLFLAVTVTSLTRLPAICRSPAVRAESTVARTRPAVTGPLRVHPDNPRYFTDGTRNPDGTLRAVGLIGCRRRTTSSHCPS